MPQPASNSVRDLQLQELSILKVFNKLCTKHDLHYFLSAGTLLGAVRHQGFIPWDDDIDVVMPHDDYDRFISLANNELPSNLFLQTEDTDPLYPFDYAKLRLNGTYVSEPVFKDVDMHQGIYIDIFPLDPCPESPRECASFFKTVKFFDACILGKISNVFECGYTKGFARLAYRFAHHLPIKSLRRWRARTQKRAARHADGTQLCTVSGTHDYPAETYRAVWFEKVTPLSFEGDQYPCPACWHDLLQHMYGDYECLPADNERSGHFITVESE